VREDGLHTLDRYTCCSHPFQDTDRVCGASLWRHTLGVISSRHSGTLHPSFLTASVGRLSFVHKWSARGKNCSLRGDGRSVLRVMCPAWRSRLRGHLPWIATQTRLSHRRPPFCFRPHFHSPNRPHHDY